MRIGEELVEAHPDVDPIAVSFPDLKQMVMDLEGFEEAPGHPCNERILEAVQQHWLDELED